MTSLTAFNRTSIRLRIATAICCLLISPVSAGVQDSVFFISSDGSSVAFDVRDVSRGEVLRRLLQGRVIELEWVDAAFADERISGVFNGSFGSVLQRLLAQTDFVAVYNREGGKSSIARLIIVGKVTPPGTNATAPVPQPGAITIAPASTRVDLATPFYIPVLPGTVTAPVVAPLAAGKSLPTPIPQLPTTSGAPLPAPREIR